MQESVKQPMGKIRRKSNLKESLHAKVLSAPSAAVQGKKERRKRGFANNAIGMLHRNLCERIAVYRHYHSGDDDFKCACCGETEFSFLSLDHIEEGTGNSERSEFLGNRYRGGHHFYRELRLRNYPPGYQVLCMNCQVGRRDNGGVCPHQTKRLTASALLNEFDKLRVGSSGQTLTQGEEYKSALANVRRVSRR